MKHNTLTPQEVRSHTRNFVIDRKKLKILKKDIHVNLGIKIDTKRDPVYEKLWVDTKPKDITDFAGEESLIIKYEELKDEFDKLKREKNTTIQSFSPREESLQEEKTVVTEENTLVQDKERTTSYIHPHKEHSTDIQTSLTEDRTLLDKEEPTEVTNPTLDEKKPTLKRKRWTIFIDLMDNYPEEEKRKRNQDPPNNR